MTGSNKCHYMPRFLRPSLHKIRQKHRMWWLYLAAACVFALGGPVLANSDAQISKLRTGLQNLEQFLDQPSSQIISLKQTAARFGLQDYIETGAISGIRQHSLARPKIRAPLHAQVMDMRLGLAMLTQSYGASENKVVLDAQNSDVRNALVLMRGEATLADIRALLLETRLQTARAGISLTLDVPLIIWSDATLRLAPGEILLLNRARGAFVLNFGHMTIDGATIAVAGDENLRSLKFNPFVTTAGGGSVQVNESNITGLGFGYSPKFSGFSVLRNALFPARHSTYITNSFFSDIVGIALSGVADPLIQGNNLRNMRGNALSLRQSPHARVVLNLFSGEMQTNAIRVENNSINASIAGNIILGGSRAGIVVRYDSHDAQVTKNIVWRRDGGGIMLAQSKCGQISDNLVLDNAQKGVEIRSSSDSIVAQNLIASNNSAGIWVSAQADLAQTFIGNNRLVSNGAGIATATGGRLILQGNDFSAQFPRLLSGDLALQSHHIAQNIRDKKQISLTTSGVSDNIKPSESCTNFDDAIRRSQ